MPRSQKRILVTGASGFVGAQVVEHLLKAGYAVRGTSRSNKAEQLRNNCSHPHFEVTVVNDLVSGDFCEALQDVDAVIHVASPTIGKTDFIEVAIGGTMNLLRQAYQAGVFKITVLSSYASLFTTPNELADASRTITDKDWRQVTREQITPDTPPVEAYAASKALAERAAWEFAESHPEIDLITILPPYIYGPFASTQVISDPSSFTTNGLIYQLFAKPVPSYPTAYARHVVDVRDVATAAVLSLSAKKREPGERRRIILYGGSVTWTEIVRHLGHVRPKLRARLVDGGEPPADKDDVSPVANLDTSKAKEILGLSTFINWKKCVEDTVDNILEKEAKGEI